MFDLFSQRGVESTRTEGGLGIGLALVLGLTAAMGGRASYESTPVGPRFSLRLPIAPDPGWATLQAEARAERLTKARQESPSNPPPLATRRRGPSADAPTLNRPSIPPALLALERFRELPLGPTEPDRAIELVVSVLDVTAEQARDVRR
jgi:hypothetical protein